MKVHESRVGAIQTSSEIFFRPFFTSFDRTRVVDHEKLIFRLSECFLSVELYEKLIFFKICEIFYFVLFSASENSFSRFSIKN
jgi:hypothetical protein